METLKQQLEVFDKIPVNCDIPLMVDSYKICWAGRETRSSRRYNWDNRVRGEQMLFCIQNTVSGCGYIERNGVRALVPANHAMLFWHEEDSRYGYAEESKTPYVLDFLTIVGPQCAEIFQQLVRLSGGVMPLPKQSEPRRLLDEVGRRFKEKQFQDSLHESLLIYELLTSLLRDASRIPVERDPIAYAAEYIERRFHMPITMEEVARAAGVSREHLTRQLTRRWGQSPGKKLQELRLQAGRDYLRHTTAPIEAIGQHCGYLDPDGFARAFARRFKLSPSKYRQRYLERSVK
ncbi:AraC family transcriptional regulator [Cerasicoccus frondis]|uniref:AraC family transcriptional regulator n=1 Tax=Cerasicoccus frondis TaxID=490090 RepID=UPI002852CFBD|nr:AraC family transcriptional regulator [Cerasicoccus frondis]